MEQASHGIDQYVILGARRRRLIDLGFGVPEWLRLVPVDFEAGGSWPEELAAAGFDSDQPAVVVSAGVSMYLTSEANAAALHQIAGFAPASTLAMTFLLPTYLHDDAVRPGFEAAERGAKAAGTPFISFYTPDEMLELARRAGFHGARHVSAAMLNERYFAGRTDGLRAPRGEELLVATT